MAAFTTTAAVFAVVTPYGNHTLTLHATTNLYRSPSLRSIILRPHSVLTLQLTVGRAVLCSTLACDKQLTTPLARDAALC